MSTTSSPPSRIVIDGSVLEGGGQILRNSISLSTLLSKPITINKIRENRSPPGLKAQHAIGLRLAAELSSGNLTNCEIGSRSINFTPGPITIDREYLANTPTAGAITLLLQVALPCLTFAPSPTPSNLSLRGGTNADFAPQIDYTQHVFQPFLSKHFGLHPTITIHKRGFYPKGGGQVHFSMPPIAGPLPPITLTNRGYIKFVHGHAYIARLSPRLAKNMITAAKAKLVSSGIDPSIIKITPVCFSDNDSVGSGAGVVLFAETSEGCVLGGTAVSRKGRSEAMVAQYAVAELLRNINHGGCVDEYLQDQMIIFMALAQGRSTVLAGPLTLHTKSAIWVAEQLTDAKFEVQEDGDNTMITCDGTGFTAPNSVDPPSPDIPLS